MQATITAANYESFEPIETQGTRQSIQKHLNKGYFIKQSRNGYWVLNKPAVVEITLQTTETTRTYNMKQEILDHYGKEKISQKLVTTFVKDVNSGKINIDLDSNGTYSIK